MIRPVLAVAGSLIAGAALAHPAMTAFDTTMRAAPSAHARIVQRIPGHAEIDVGECGDVWCPASWRDINGFVKVDAVGPSDAPLVEREPGPYYGGPYYGGPVFVGPAFGFGYYRHW